MVGHLLQYHPIFKTVLKMIKKGDIGEINYIYSSFMLPVYLINDFILKKLENNEF